MANEFIARNGIIARDSSEITGSLKVTGGITGSVLGTSSFATALVGGTTVNIADESSLQGSSALINFTGNAVAATVSSNTASVSISTGSTVSTIAGTTNEILVNNGTSAVNGAVTLSLPATVDLGANSSFIATSLTGSLTASSLVGDVRLGTQTSGDYVANITAGNGLASTGATTGENISHTLSVNAGAGISVTAPTSDAVNLDTGSVHFLDGVKKELNTETVLSGSVSSPSQGTISVGGFTNIDLGLQTGDNVTFNNITSTGNVVIQGNLTAQQFIVSSSVYFTTTSFSSGSTIFGNDLGDTHQFTGSLRVLGSITGSISASNLVGDIILGTQTSGQYASTIAGGAGLTATAANANDGTAYTIDAVAGLGISLTAPTNDAINIDTGSAHFTGGVTNRLNTLNVLSGSVSSPSQGTISVGGFANIDLGLQSGDDVTFNRVTATNGLTGSLTASSLIGDIRLGTQTSGDYVRTLTQGTGVTITSATGEGSNPTIAIGQAVATTSNVQFNSITASIVSASQFTGSLFGSSSYALTASYALSAGGVGGGVTSFNTRTGAVTLQASDVSNLGAGIISASSFTSPSQGTLRPTINGVAQSDVDLGLQSGDDVTFNKVTATNGLTGSLTASSLQGAILNTQLQNSSVTVGSTNIALGGTSTTLAGLSSVSSTSLTGSITASSLQGAILNTQLQNSSVTVGTTAISLGGTQTTIAGLVSLTSTGLTGSLTASSLQGLINNNQLRNSTISGISLGSSLANLTQGTGVTAFTYNGSTAQTIAIGQDVGTTANVTFGSVTGTNGLTGSLTASSLRGAIINTQLQNSSVTIGNTAVSLGGTATTITGLTSVTSTNFVGTASFAGTASYALTAGGTGGSTITIADEGTSQGSAGLLNFTGNAVTATVASNTASLTISTGSTVSTVAGTTNQIAVNGGTAAVNGAVTISLPSTTNLGAASSFTATSLTGSLTASSLQGAILNTQLQNSSVTVGSTNIALGGTATTIAGITSLTTTNLTSSIISASNFISGGQIIAATGFTGSISSSGLKGAILNSQLQNSSVTVGSTNISLGGTATTIAGLVSLTSTGLTGSITASSLIGDIRLGTQTSGDYVQTLTQGTGVTITSATGEGSNPTIAIGQAVGTTSDVTFNRITATNGLTGSLTASSLVGDIRLGTQTSGNYVLDVTAGAGLGKTSAAGEGQTVDLVVNAGAGISLTAPTNDAINIDTGSAHFTNGAKSTVYAGVSGDITINSSGVATIAANSVVLGTDTTGQYASTITGGAGLTATTAGGDDATAYTIDVNAGAGISLTAPTTDAVNIDTGSAHFTGGVKNKINTDGVVSGSAQVSGSIFSTVSGDISITTAGVASIAANSVTLGTDTSGDYVANITAGNGLASTGATTGENISHTLSVNAGSGISVTAPTTDAVNIDTGSAHFTNGAKSTVYAGVSGDVLIASNGAATIQPNSVALGTDTTGDYVSDVTAGAGLTKTSAAGEGQTVDLAVGAGNGITVNANDIAVIYGSTTNTAVQGNTTLTFSGTTNEITIDAGSSITLGSGGTITYGLADTIGGNRTFSADLTVQGNTFLGDATSDRVNVTSSFNVSGSAQFTGSFGVLGVTNIRSNGVVLNIDSINSNTNKIGLFDNGTVRGYLGASSTQILTVADSGGNIELSLDSSGNLISAGEMTAFGTPSDISYKEDISPITNALEKIIKLDGVKFKWKKDTDVYKLIGLEDDLGFIAQDVQNILPNIVRQNENGKLSLRERAIIPLLVESIKELKAEINNLKNKIEKFGIQ